MGDTFVPKARAMFLAVAQAFPGPKWIPKPKCHSDARRQHFCEAGQRAKPERAAGGEKRRGSKTRFKKATAQRLPAVQKDARSPASSGQTGRIPDSQNWREDQKH